MAIGLTDYKIIKKPYCLLCKRQWFNFPDCLRVSCQVLAAETQVQTIYIDQGLDKRTSCKLQCVLNWLNWGNSAAPLLEMSLIEENLSYPTYCFTTCLWKRRKFADKLPKATIILFSPSIYIYVVSNNLVVPRHD